MAVTSGFFNSLNGDRRYNAEQMSEIFNGIINDGVFSSVGTAFAVTASEGNTITIGIGRGWFNSAWIYNDAILPLTLSNSETLLDRIDAVVIEINHSIGVRSGSIKVVNGTPATTPENPTLVNIDDVHQYPLAYIYRAAGSTSIVQANITNKVGTSDCPYVTGILEVQNIDNIVAQWQSEFDIWFANLEDSLSGDVAVNLANDILALQSQFEDLALYKTVYVELEDSQDNTIQDSNGNPIYGATTFGDSNTEGGSSGQPVVVSESQYKPGDTLTTARNDLDESWLLCNGAEVTRTDYPQLAAQFPPKPTDPYASSIIKAAYSGEYGFESVTVYNMIKTDDYYVAAVTYHDDSGWHDGVMYSTSLTGSWTNVDLNSYIGTIRRLRYVNGYYVVVGSASGTYYSVGTIVYATNPAGPWTSKQIFEASSRNIQQNGIYDIAYGGGYYVTVGTRGIDDYNSEARIDRCATLDGTWQVLYDEWDAIEDEYGDPENNHCIVNHIVFANNRFEMCGYQDQNDTYRYSMTVSSGSLTGPNAYRVSNYSYADHMFYANGYFFISGGTTFYYYTDTSSVSGGSFPFSVSDIIYDDVRHSYVMFGVSSSVPMVAYTSDFTNGESWSSASISSSGDVASGFMDGQLYVAAGTQSGNAVVYYSDTEVFTLPAISLSDKTYTYIKAKED